MRSSTSSSDRPPAERVPPNLSGGGGGAPSAGLVLAAARLLRAFGPPVIVAVLLLAALAAASTRLRGRPGGRDLENIVIGEQMRRATTVGRADLVILGDSSALMGVDAGKLGDLLGIRVESFATFGWVGPAASGSLLQRFAERNGPPPAVLVLMCGEGLKVDEDSFSRHGFERQVLDGLRPDAVAAEPPLERVYKRLFLPLVDPPLAGRLGFYYGWPEDVIAKLARDGGTLVDPTLRDDGSIIRSYRFELLTPVEDRLRWLGKAIAATSAPRVFVSVSPLAALAVGPLTEGSRAAVLERMVFTLGLPDTAALASPAVLPTEAFATFTHLNARGRQAYTRDLARVLGPRLAPAKP
jgi:hypothetical protein